MINYNYEEFYGDLEQILNLKKEQEITILKGDMNVKIGEDR